MSTPHTRLPPDHKVIWLGVGSLLAASISYVFAWNGGLWAAPIWLSLAVTTWWTAWRRRTPGRGRAGVVIACAAMLLGGYAFLSSGGLQPALRTDSSSYLPGDVVSVRLRGGIPFTGYNLCFEFATLERLDGVGWNPVDVNLGPHEGGPWGCTTEGIELPFLLSAKGAVYLPRDLPSGRYRLAYEVEVDGKLREVATGSFTVREEVAP